MTQVSIQQALKFALWQHQAGRLADAERIYCQILALNPNDHLTLNLLGALVGEAGRLDEAIELIGRAIAINPAIAAYHSNLGEFQRRLGKLPEAIAALRRGVEIDPKSAKGHYNLGIALQDAEDLPGALEAYQRATQLKKDYAKAYSNMGTVLREMGKVEAAVAACELAIELVPSAIEGWINLGQALRRQGKLDEAMAVFQKALTIQPDSVDAHNCIGNVLDDKRQYDEAIAAYRRAIQIKPDVAYIRWNLAILLLSLGRLPEGWDEFEWRLKFRDLRLRRDLPSPQWNGEDLAGKTLLLHTEGGYGDAFHFVRYVPRLCGRPKKMILECQPGLARLFSDLSGVDQIVERGQRFPQFDYQIPLQSLPRLFKTDLSNIPNSVPYLKVPPNCQSKWKSRIESDGRLKVGLMWAGSPRRQVGSDIRTRDLDVFAPLGKITKVRFFSLQKGPESTIASPPGLDLIDFTAEISDFADTAAIIENLDLVISVDTSVAHLAGALAKPVWVLIPKSADFRWLMDRTDSPWYPTMRLFRQKRQGDWASVIEEMTVELLKVAIS